MITLDVGPDRQRIASGVNQPRRLSEFLLSLRQLTVGDSSERLNRSIYAFVVFELRFVVLFTDCETRRRIGFGSLKLLDVSRDRVSRSLCRLLEFRLKLLILD